MGMKDITADKKPLVSLLQFLGLTLLCSVVIQSVAMAVGALLSPGFTVSTNDYFSLTDTQLFSLKIFLLISSLSTFLLPALWLQYKERQFNYFPHEQIKSYLPYILVFLIMIAFLPLMNWIGELNQKMELPESWKVVENWMKASEKQMAQLTERIVMDTSVTALLMNVIVLALVPAVVEEFFFRGVLQGIFQRWIGNWHITILITGIVFSAIHFQFYGFLPRMLLGVFFGYLMVWSKNIWLPVFAHFLNNFTVTVIGFVYTRQGKTFDELQETTEFSSAVYLFSFVVTASLVAAIFVYFRRNKSEIMKEDWHKIREFQNEIEAEMVKQMLESNGVPAVVMNKKDSSYLFGKLELYVNNSLIEEAEALLNDNNQNINATDEN